LPIPNKVIKQAQWPAKASGLVIMTEINGNLTRRCRYNYWLALIINYKKLITACMSQEWNITKRAWWK